MKPKSKVLIIAGSDSSGGAGIQADIKTVTALGSYATTAITAVTAQNTKGVKKIIPIPAKIVKKQIGDDYDDLYQRSPISKAANIKVPVLLIHGTKDRVVGARHSEEMYDTLNDLHKSVKYVELENGDHYLSNNKHRLTTFIEIERFLAANLGVK